MPLLFALVPFDEVVLFLPEGADPGLDSVPEHFIVLVVSAEEFLGNRHPLHSEAYPVDAAAQIIPERGLIHGVDDGDVQDICDLAVHGGQGKGKAPCLGPQQMTVGGLLTCMLLFREPGAFDEVQDGDRGMPVSFACLPGGFQVFALHVWVLLQIALGVAFHKGVIQRPPADSQQGHPEELLLQEKLEERDMPVEAEKQDQNVGP